MSTSRASQHQKSPSVLLFFSLKTNSSSHAWRFQP
ncbi:rCG48969 [Rattus norvegicus]|uniref:RCG48969 n=1 Tax=Rattus norvegicus TaxID=10116 RepID=A6IGD3_RAT|nr:rCG48969 [Rattus norvegicus]